MYVCSLKKKGFIIIKPALYMPNISHILNISRTLKANMV